MSATPHVLPLRIYFGVFGLLMLGTGLTVWVAEHDFHPFNLLIALAIATLKAALVVMFFMHVKYSNRLITLAVCASIFWLMLLFGITLADYLTRSSAAGWVQ